VDDLVEGTTTSVGKREAIDVVRGSSGSPEKADRRRAGEVGSRTGDRRRRDRARGHRPPEPRQLPERLRPRHPLRVAGA
jgi:hypothetical protein